MGETTEGALLPAIAKPERLRTNIAGPVRFYAAGRTCYARMIFCLESSTAKLGGLLGVRGLHVKMADVRLDDGE